MVIISANSLKKFEKYYETKVKLKIVHFCPLDGREDDPKSKRIVVTSDASHQSSERYLVIVFYGCYAKTPFKKSALKAGQLFTLHRFETGVMPKNKVFKCNGQILKDFYEPLVLVKPEFEPIIKMLVSLREETFVLLPECDSSEDNKNQPIEDNVITIQNNVSQRVSPIEVMVAVKSPVKKRLKFESSDDEIDVSSEESFDTNCRRTTRSSFNGQKKRVISSETNKSNDKTNRINKIVIENNKNSEQIVERQQRYEYKTLLDVHKLLPVSGKKFCHIYGILRRREYKQNIYYLRDEKAFSFTIHLRPGNSTFRDYPAAKPGDILRIHRILLAPNTMDIICTDPKDVVIFEAFQDSDSFSPIHTSLKPSFEEFDRHRKQELEEWFSDDLIANENLSEKGTSNEGYIDLAVQVLRVTTSRDRSYLEVWDTTRPALKTNKSQVSMFDMNLNQSEEELIRIVNENSLSVLVTVYEQHSNDAQSLKPFDFIVLFNVKVMADKYNRDCYTYTLNSGYHYGKCIRFVKPNSCLGKKLWTRIEEYKVMSAVNVTHSLSSNEFPTPSQPLDFDESQNRILREIQMSALEEESLMDDNFDIQVNQMDITAVIEGNQRKQMYLPDTYDVVIPQKDIQIDELVSKGVDKQLYKIKARVVSYDFKDKIDIICVYCANPHCLRIVTLRQALREDSNLQTIIDNSNENKFVLNCFKCKKTTAFLTFRLLFCLEDNKRSRIMAELFSRNAELFFKRTPENALHVDSDTDYIQSVLRYLCPEFTPIDSAIGSTNILIHWVIEPSKWNETQFRYLIRTGLPIQTSDKCVGQNLL